MRGLNQAVAVAAMCLNEEPAVRPLISDVVTALSFLGTGPDTDATAMTLPSPPSEHNMLGANGKPLDQESMIKERERAVAEAMEWGSHSRHNAKSRPGSASSF